MNLSENHFKKFLADEIIRASNASVKEALCAVNEFSKEERFKKSFEQWKSLQFRKKIDIKKPKKMKDIILELFN